MYRDVSLSQKDEDRINKKIHTKSYIENEVVR